MEPQILLASMVDAPITFTVKELWLAVIAICGGVVTINAAIIAISAIIKKLHKPKEDKEQAIETRFVQLESRLNHQSVAINTMADKYGELVDHYHKTARRHDEIIASLIDGQKLLLEVQRASIDFKLNDGKDKAALKAMDEKIDEYLKTIAYKSMSKPSDDDLEDINITFTKNIRKMNEEVTP